MPTQDQTVAVARDSVVRGVESEPGLANSESPEMGSILPSMHLTGVVASRRPGAPVGTPPIAELGGDDHDIASGREALASEQSKAAVANR